MNTPCPVKGCQALGNPTRPMCDAHWNMVPKALRAQIKNHLRKTKNGKPGNAILAAISIIEQKEQTDETTAADTDV